MHPTSKFSDTNSCRIFSALKETLRFEKLLLDTVWAVKDLPPPAKTSPLLVFNAGVGASAQVEGKQGAGYGLEEGPR